MTISFSSKSEQRINGWWTLERTLSTGEHEIALVDKDEWFKHVSRGATRELAILGLKNSGYEVPEGF